MTDLMKDEDTEGEEWGNPKTSGMWWYAFVIILGLAWLYYRYKPESMGPANWADVYVAVILFAVWGFKNEYESLKNKTPKVITNPIGSSFGGKNNPIDMGHFVGVRLGGIRAWGFDTHGGGWDSYLSQGCLK